MIDLEAFRKGMGFLGAAFNRAVTKELLDVFGGVLSAKLTTEQWESAVKRALEAEKFFPAPAVLLRYGLGEGSPKAQAITAYEQILAAFESGRKLGPRDVREGWGHAAMEAFVASGGARAFAWCEPENEPFRRRDFAAAWVETVEQDPRRALPAGAEKLLT